MKHLQKVLSVFLIFAFLISSFSSGIKVVRAASDSVGYITVTPYQGSIKQYDVLSANFVATVSLASLADIWITLYDNNNQSIVLYNGRVASSVNTSYNLNNTLNFAVTSPPVNGAFSILTKITINNPGKNPGSTSPRLTAIKTFQVGAIIPPKYSITGQIRDNSGYGIAYAGLSYSGKASNNLTTDAYGQFTISNLDAGTYYLTASKSYYAFTPNPYTINLNSNTSNVLFFGTYNPPNQPPVANAGPDQTVTDVQMTTLNGSGSSDPENSALTYSWYEGSTLLSNSVSFSKVYTPGIHTVTLTVRDGGGLTSTDTVVVTCNVTIKYSKVTTPAPTIAQNDVGRTPNMNWSAAGNPAGTHYKLYIGTLATLLNYTSDTTSIYYNATLNFGTQYYWRVDTIAGDGAVITGDIWNFTTIAGKAPIANAGSDVEVGTGMSFTLDGSKSYDTDGNIAKYEWYEGTSLISNTIQFNSVFFTTGEHKYTLRVTDNDGFVGSDDVIINVGKVELSISDIRARITNRSVIGGFIPVTINNPIAAPDPLMNSSAFIYHSNDGTAKILVKNTGTIDDRYVINTNSSYDVRFGNSEARSLVSSTWDGDYHPKFYEFSLASGEEKWIDVFLKTDSSFVKGTPYDIPISILSVKSASTIVETNIVYSVFDNLALETIGGIMDQSIDYYQGLFRFWIADDRIILNDKAPVYSRLAEVGMLLLTADEFMKVGGKLLATGAKPVVKIYFVKEVEQMATKEGAEGVLGRTLLEKSDSVLAEQFVKNRGAGILDNVTNTTAKDVLIKAVDDKMYKSEFIRNIDKFKNVEGFDKFVDFAGKNAYQTGREGVKTEARLYATMSERGSTLKQVSQYFETLTLDNGKVLQKLELDGLSIDKAGKNVIHEAKNTLFNESNFKQLEKYKELLATNWEGMNNANTYIEFVFSEINPKANIQDIMKNVAKTYGVTFATEELNLGTGMGKILAMRATYKVLQLVPNYLPGTYNSAINVKFSEQNGAQYNVLYTLDGTTPTSSSLQYNSGGIAIAKSTTFKYITYDPVTMYYSEMKTLDYTINAPDYNIKSLVNFTTKGATSGNATINIPNLAPFTTIVNTQSDGTMIFPNKVDLNLVGVPVTGAQIIQNKTNNTLTLDGNVQSNAAVKNGIVHLDIPINSTGINGATGYMKGDFSYLSNSQVAFQNFSPLNIKIPISLGNLILPYNNRMFAANTPVNISVPVFGTNTLPVIPYSNYSGVGFNSNTVLRSINFSWSNPTMSAYIAPTVSANPSSKTNKGALNVILTPSVAGSAIFYTINGIDPTINSTRYLGPINIAKTTTLKYFTVDNSGYYSSVKTESYVIN